MSDVIYHCRMCGRELPIRPSTVGGRFREFCIDPAEDPDSPNRASCRVMAWTIANLDRFMDDIVFPNTPEGDKAREDVQYLLTEARNHLYARGITLKRARTLPGQGDLFRR